MLNDEPSGHLLAARIAKRVNIIIESRGKKGHTLHNPNPETRREFTPHGGRRELSAGFDTVRL